MLALATAVPRGGVVVADAGVPRGVQSGSGVGFFDRLELVSQPGTPKSELRDFNVGAAKSAANKRIHE